MIAVTILALLPMFSKRENPRQIQETCFVIFDVIHHI